MTNGGNKRPKQEVTDLQQLTQQLIDSKPTEVDYEDLHTRPAFNIKKLSIRERGFLKQQAIMLMSAGFSATETAYCLQLPIRTVYFWRSDASAEDLKAIEKANLQTVQQRLTGALNTCLTAVERIALFTTEKQYLQAQDPEKVQKLFEGLTTFCMRLIEAKQRADIATKEIQLKQKQYEAGVILEQEAEREELKYENPTT